MSLAEFLSNCTPEELREKLLELDMYISIVHANGNFLSDSFLNIKLGDEGEITNETFSSDKLSSLYDDEGKYRVFLKNSDILELCIIGICAYNNQSIYYVGSRDFINNLTSNLELYLNNDNINERIQDDIKEYYQTVFDDYRYHNAQIRETDDDKEIKELESMNGYLDKKNATGKGNSNVLVKATAIGKALDNKEAAFVNVLIVPSILVLIYLVLLVGYFLLK